MTDGAMLVALRHRAAVLIADVRRARRQLAAMRDGVRGGAGDGGDPGWPDPLCDVLHALDKAAELAHLVTPGAEALPAVHAIAAPACGFTVPASVTLRVEGGLAHYPLGRVERGRSPPG